MWYNLHVAEERCDGEGMPPGSVTRSQMDWSQRRSLTEKRSASAFFVGKRCGFALVVTSKLGPLADNDRRTL